MAVESEGLPLPAAPALEATSAVSRALQIVDIVQEILESLCSRPLTLSDYRAFIPTRKIFLCTALTCHSFLEPSLDILWRSMHSIAPLLKLLEGSRKSDGEDTVLDASVFQPTMHKIAKLRFVKAIGLDLGGSVKHVQSWETWSTSVEHLRLKGSARQITTFLTSHSMSHLRHIRLEFPSSYAKYTQPTEDWSNFKRTLSSMVSRWQHIQGIILDIEVFIPYISSQRSPFREILQPLKRLTQLKRLRIDPETPVRTFTSLSSTDYWELGNAFPGLEHLALPCGNMMTFDVLYKIALLCPRLRSLAVGIDTQIIPVPLSSQYPPIAHDLEVLSVGNSPLTNIPSVTRHLHRLFPRLKTIIATNSAWDPVLDFLELHKNMVMDSSERRASTTELLDHLKAKHALDLASSSAGRVDVSRGPKKKRGVKRT
ncbi:hypothetical protein BDN72DRAFT_854974 [Pluteus cervinus]|uniref:Uncharacterized protein n=1 Tax=Pluteus cervinus TaxID=181527 RepID=A0ACD3B4T0_9AGAR|nr:hypothetical protein BDN72DRAFT_854974 [Pluteus cervinus]